MASKLTTSSPVWVPSGRPCEDCAAETYESRISAGESVFYCFVCRARQPTPSKEMTS